MRSLSYLVMYFGLLGEDWLYRNRYVLAQQERQIIFGPKEQNFLILGPLGSERAQIVVPEVEVGLQTPIVKAGVLGRVLLAIRANIPYV
jgi:hypothetical protein